MRLQSARVKSASGPGNQRHQKTASHPIEW